MSTYDENKNLLAMTTMAFIAMSPMAFAASSAETQDFVTSASIGNQFEIDSSKLALKKSKNAAIKEFAQKMIDDHMITNKRLKAALASSMTETDPSLVNITMDDKHEDILKDLTEASDADFDKEYIDAQISAHEDTVVLFKEYAKNGDDVSLKEFATKTLPTLQKHHDHVKGLEKSIDK